MKKGIDKYNEVRDQIKAGMIIVFRGSSVISKAIQWADSKDGKDAYFNHIGIVFEAMGRLFIIDSNAPGVHPEFLSSRVAEYEDFACIDLCQRPDDIARCLQTLMDKAQAGIKYNFGRLFMILAKDKLGMDIPGLDQGGHDICSQFAQVYTNLFPVACFSKDQEITPMGFIRESDETVKILFYTPD